MYVYTMLCSEYKLLLVVLYNLLTTEQICRDEPSSNHLYSKFLNWWTVFDENVPTQWDSLYSGDIGHLFIKIFYVSLTGKVYEDEVVGKSWYCTTQSEQYSIILISFENIIKIILLFVFRVHNFIQHIIITLKTKQ